MNSAPCDGCRQVGGKRAEDVASHSGFRLTTVTRSLVDVVAVGADEDQLSRAIPEAVDAGQVTIRRGR